MSIKMFNESLQIFRLMQEAEWMFPGYMPPSKEEKAKLAKTSKDIRDNSPYGGADEAHGKHGSLTVSLGREKKLSPGYSRVWKSLANLKRLRKTTKS